MRVFQPINREHILRTFRASSLKLRLVGGGLLKQIDRYKFDWVVVNRYPRSGRALFLTRVLPGTALSTLGALPVHMLAPSPAQLNACF
jgi:hypothetical protein